MLTKAYENYTSFNLLKCNGAECPIWFRSEFSLTPTQSVMGNVSKSMGILLLNGEKQFSNSYSTIVSVATKTS